jgi:diaminohydroxyphosphoribosylaminopyrimidine deaminase/5-amino-6-(5-phosphoribosylamino)uracil reductase
MAASEDMAFMRRAIALAEPRVGLTGANPAVGCVVAKDGVVVGEGATGEGGRPHAEELALAAAGEKAQGATAYVTLEPCGERSSGAPSCAARLIEAKVGRVVIACANPHGLSAGRGPDLLRRAGVEVEAGLEADAAAVLYDAFLSRLASDPSNL